MSMIKFCGPKNLSISQVDDGYAAKGVPNVEGSMESVAPVRDEGTWLRCQHDAELVSRRSQGYEEDKPARTRCYNHNVVSSCMR